MIAIIQITLHISWIHFASKLISHQWAIWLCVEYLHLYILHYYSAFSLFVLLDEKFLISLKSTTLRILVLSSIFVFAYNFALATASSLGVTTWYK